MRTIDLETIESMEHGEVIPRFVGTVRKVLEQKTGEGEYGTWHLQTLFVGENGSAHEIAVTWCGECPFAKSEEGQQYEFAAGEDKKGKLAGIQRDIRSKNGKTYKGVKVDDRAKVKRLENDFQKAKATMQEPEQGWEQEDAQRAAQSSGNAPPARPQVATPVDEARKHLCQAANLYNLCVKCVNSMIADELPEVARTSEQFQAAVGTLFIEASRAGFVNKMPEKPIKNGN